ncbi:MAG: molybdate ABC transporter substrate-binding protein [Actinomycetota bacterium]|nr:molybdate ABC transporter substrate-binding protein [Actinomycetota bacterium]
MRRLIAPIALTLLLPLGGCGADDRTLTILAAASLTDVFEELAVDFEEEHDVEVDLSFGSSTDLAAQAADGAPSDVLATADPESMAIAEGAGVVDRVRQFTANRLLIVTTPDADVDGPADLADVPWVRCADEVPCGRVAVALLAEQGITAEPVSLEEDVRAVLDKVTNGEATAGLVYGSDARSAGSAVRTVPIPGADRHLASYRIATLDQAQDDELARDWVKLLTSEPGRAALRRAGFVMR